MIAAEFPKKPLPVPKRSYNKRLFSCAGRRLTETDEPSMKFLSKTDSFSLTPAVGWMWAEDYDAAEWEASVTAHQWLTESLGIGATYTFSEGPDHGHTLIGLFSVRF